jgi:hypothetical protein
MAGTEARDATGDPTLLDEKQRAIAELKSLLEREEFKDKYISAQMRGRRVQESDATSEIDQIKRDLETRREDPLFLEALDVWGRSPNAAGEIGEDGQGFHSGVIHYFEYRSHPGKTGRYIGTEQERPSIQGFIDFSTQLKALTETPYPSTNRNIDSSALIADDEGNRRLLLLTNEGFLIVGFQKANDRMRIITAGEGKGLIGHAAHELATTPDMDERLNRLGEGRKLVWAHSRQFG